MKVSAIEERGEESVQRSGGVFAGGIIDPEPRHETILPMETEHFEFMTGRVIEDLSIVVDEGHEFVTQLSSNPCASAHHEAFVYARLMIHEWLANLVQHARFDDRRPTVKIRVQYNGTGIQFAVEDNSSGFDLLKQLQRQKDVLQPLPERGFGLLLLRACAERMVYSTPAANCNILSFTVGRGGFLDVTPGMA